MNAEPQYVNLYVEQILDRIDGGTQAIGDEVMVIARYIGVADKVDRIVVGFTDTRSYGARRQITACWYIVRQAVEFLMLSFDPGKPPEYRVFCSRAGADLQWVAKRLSDALMAATHENHAVAEGHVADARTRVEEIVKLVPGQS